MGYRASSCARERRHGVDLQLAVEHGEFDDAEQVKLLVHRRSGFQFFLAQLDHAGRDRRVFRHAQDADGAAAEGEVVRLLQHGGGPRVDRQLLEQAAGGEAGEAVFIGEQRQHGVGGG